MADQRSARAGGASTAPRRKTAPKKGPEDAARVEEGGLSDDQVDEIGTTLMLLDQRMQELCDQHGVRPEDLNLDLGPLGTLLPRD
jgi:hypothetical protein